MKGFGALFSFACLAVASAKSNVIDLTPKNFDEIVLKSGKPALVEFFAVRPLLPYICYFSFNN
jgi:protein disulfide-isomerase A6